MNVPAGQNIRTTNKGIHSHREALHGLCLDDWMDVTIEDSETRNKCMHVNGSDASWVLIIHETTKKVEAH